MTVGLLLKLIPLKMEKKTLRFLSPLISSISHTKVPKSSVYKKVKEQTVIK